MLSISSCREEQGDDNNDTVEEMIEDADNVEVKDNKIKIENNDGSETKIKYDDDGTVEKIKTDDN